MKDQTQSETKEKTKGYLYLIFPDSVLINRYHVNQVRSAVENSKCKNLDLIIDSPGGYAYSAVKIIRILRHKFENITGIVPFYAMSAATLMMLGTNKIFMGEESQLGPLDLPIEHPTDGSRISALDVVNSLNQLSSTSRTIAEDRFDFLKNRLGKVISAKIAFESADNLIKPVVSKLDPYHIQKGFRELKIAQWYAFDLLRTGMMRNDPNSAWETATKFVHSFPDHSYAIFKEDAVDTLSLNVGNSDDYVEWQNISNEIESEKKGLVTASIKYIEK